MTVTPVTCDVTGVTPPDELARMVAMLGCLAATLPSGIRNPFSIDEQLGIAAVLALHAGVEHRIGTLAAMRENLVKPASDSDADIETWSMAWRAYRDLVGMLPAIVTDQHLAGDDVARAEWWERCS